MTFMTFYDLYSEKDREIITDIRDSFEQEFTMRSYDEVSNRIVFVFKHYSLTHLISITCRGNVLRVHSHKLMYLKQWTKELSKNIAGLNLLLEIGSFVTLPHMDMIYFSLTVPLYEKPPREFVLQLIAYSLYALDEYVPEIFRRASRLGLVQNVCTAEEYSEDKNMEYFYR